MPNWNLCLRRQIQRWTLAVASLCSPAFAVEYTAEALKEPAPREAYSEEIHAQLLSTGIRVLRDGAGPLCDIWFCKEWAAKDGFSPTLQIQFPFETGQLMGVIRYHRQGEDFRGQQVPKGLYTVRFALQPVDGNHIGTSDTRDFFLLVSPEVDKSPEPSPADDLFIASGEAIESSHPAMLNLRSAVSAGTEDELPKMEHDESFDLWVLYCKNSIKAGEDEKELAIGVVLVGHSEFQ